MRSLFSLVAALTNEIFLHELRFSENHKLQWQLLHGQVQTLINYRGSESAQLYACKQTLTLFACYEEFSSR